VCNLSSDYCYFVVYPRKNDNKIGLDGVIVKLLNFND